MSKPKKLKGSDILAAEPLTDRAIRLVGDQFHERCGVCGHEADPVLLKAWRECDANDRPIERPEAIVLIEESTTHYQCRETLDAHPRLYKQISGVPGMFPRLCGPCPHRDGRSCRHQKLTANGGPGLLVKFHDPFKNAIICSAEGRIVIPPRAESCEGREP